MQENQWRTSFARRLKEIDALLKSYAKPYEGGGNGDCCDEATYLLEEENRLKRLLDLHRERDQIVLALDRIYRGTFGICERCGGPIPEGRLEIFPTTTVCHQCK